MEGHRNSRSGTRQHLHPQVVSWAGTFLDGRAVLGEPQLLAGLFNPTNTPPDYAPAFFSLRHATGAYGCCAVAAHACCAAGRCACMLCRDREARAHAARWEGGTTTTVCAGMLLLWQSGMLVTPRGGLDSAD